MLTNKICAILEPLVNERMDDYLIRATASKELRQSLLDAAKEELTHSQTPSLKEGLTRMHDILEGAGKKYFITPGDDDKEYWGELVFSRPVKKLPETTLVLSRPATHDKPKWLKELEERKRNNK